MLNYLKLPQKCVCFCYNLVSKNQKHFAYKMPLLMLTNCPYQMSMYTSLQANIKFVKNDYVKHVVSRYKSKGRKKKFATQQDDDDDDDDDEGFEDELDESDDTESREKGVEVKTYSLDSLRIDLVLKTVLGYNRKHIEESFYKNKIQLNGGPLFKKSINAKIGDEIDILKDAASENSKFLNIGRVQVLDIKSDTENDKLLVKVRRTKSLLIKNPDN